MKVAQLALDDYSNYGNFLQKYAIHTTIKKFADDVEFLWYIQNTFWPEGNDLPYPPKYLLERYPHEAVRWWFCEAVRVSKIKEFADRYINTRFNLPYMEDIGDEYDFFVVGSDQVWNPSSGIISNLFLPFVPREKKIAYAASIALTELPDDVKEYFRQGVKSFTHVSVREENAVKIISELGLEPPLLVLDPVFLLTRDEWLKIARRPSWFNKKYERGYILTYYLRNFPPPEIESVAAELNLPVINLLDIKNFNHYAIGPEEFLYLFAHATLIYANSFHGIAFSTLFKRPFVNCEYDDETTQSMGTRIPSLLKMFGLENRTVYTKEFNKIKSPLEIDFSRRDEILPQERMKAFKFLSKALGVEIPAELNGGMTRNDFRRNDFKKPRRLYRLFGLQKYLSEKLYNYGARRRRLLLSEDKSRRMYKLRQMRKGLSFAEFQGCNARRVA